MLQPGDFVHLILVDPLPFISYCNSTLKSLKARPSPNPSDLPELASELLESLDTRWGALLGQKDVGQRASSVQSHIHEGRM
mmetsp:Transcript_3612/g.6859  ORF Transcript_3612/g.6859 Transcript_3612/m.6859 type:complete len:81 (-) Transcript_3612:652-894(-)